MVEQVPSWAVTSEMLASWGFPVEVTDKCVGTKFVVTEGMPWGRAVHAAWAAGFVRIAAMPEAVAESRRAAFHEGIREMRAAAVANLAFLREHGSIVGPSHGKGL